MNKYKIEITRTETFVVDVYGENEKEAKEKAMTFFEEIKKDNIEHYYSTGDITEEVSTVYDVTGTDDPFNPF